MEDSPSSRLDEIMARLRAFAAARDWGKFHSPKNLAMALVVEASEVVEHFQWLTEAESGDLPPAKRDEIAHELADTMIYLLLLAERLGVDVLSAVEAKITINEQKYPVEKARGTAKKYTELGE